MTPQERFKRLLSGHYDTGECLSQDDTLLYAMRNLGWFPNSPPYSKRNKNSLTVQWYDEGDVEWKRDIQSCLDLLE